MEVLKSNRSFGWAYDLQLVLAGETRTVCMMS